MRRFDDVAGMSRPSGIRLRSLAEPGAVYGENFWATASVANWLLETGRRHAFLCIWGHLETQVTFAW